MAEPELDSLSFEDDIDFSNVPASALNVTSRMMLSKLLNPLMELMSEANYARDYRGLAQQMDFDYMDIKNFARSSDPTAAILDTWVAKPRTTIEDLLNMLKNMDRGDVIEDSLPHLKNDATSFHRRRKVSVENPVQVPEVTSCRPFESSYSMDASNEITIDDLMTGGTTQYDAYVCYAEEDLLFVHQLAQYLESPAVGLKLCIKGRDILLGNLEFNAYVRLMENRCKVLLLILTPEFLMSKECEYQMNYAAGMAVEHRQRKLIPIVLRPCNIPSFLKFLTKLDFTKQAIHDWMWNKLVASIRGMHSSFYVTPSSSTSIAGSAPSAAPLSSSPMSPQLLFTSPPPAAIMGTSPTSFMNTSQLVSGTLNSSPHPVITFPPTQTYQAISSDQISGTSRTSVVPAPNQTVATNVMATVPKNTPPTKPKWLRNFKERFSSSSSTTSTTSSSTGSSATSGFYSQSGTLFETGEIPDTETSM